jgi:superfamily II DNA or RNA helicase
MSYPNIKDKEFNKKINKKYDKYTIPKKKKTFNQICFPKDFQLQVPQEFLAKYINPNTPYKGVLIFHKIGAGKTCTAVNIGEQWKGKKNIVVVVPASLVGNFRSELRSMCAGNCYLSQKERETLEKLHPSNKEYKDIMKKSDDRINKNYKIYSYNKFVDLVESKDMNLSNSILIIDEVQNMVSESGKYYEILYDAIHKAPSTLRVVLLSATPMFDKPIEFALTMNLMRIPVEFPTGVEFEKQFIRCQYDKKTGKTYHSAKNLDLFKDMIKGYVSYFRGAPPYVFPESNIKYVKCEMSDFQHRSYLAVLESEERSKNKEKSRRKQAFKEGSILDLPNNFFIGARIISNVAFPNKDINEDGFDSFTGNHMSLRRLCNYSAKFLKILKHIMRSTGPVIIYSNFKEYGGLKSLAKILEYHGYSDYTKYGEGQVRYASWTSDIKMQTREEIKAVFNQKANYNGSKLRIILLSPSGKEGLSLRNVRQIHILEPYWNWSRMLQIIGRGIRYCSHKDLPEEKRKVNVYIYLSTHKNEPETIDQYIAKMAQKKNRLIQEFEKAIKEAAIDCTLFKNANVYPGEEPINCVV